MVRLRVRLQVLCVQIRKVFLILSLLLFLSLLDGLVVGRFRDAILFKTFLRLVQLGSESLKRRLHGLHMVFGLGHLAVVIDDRVEVNGLRQDVAIADLGPILVDCLGELLCGVLA